MKDFTNFSFTNRFHKRHIIGNCSETNQWRHNSVDLKTFNTDFRCCYMLVVPIIDFVLVYFIIWSTNPISYSMFVVNLLWIKIFNGD